MREIKFRTWNKKTRAMSDPFTLQDIINNTCKYIPDDKDIIFLQSTRLKDKNGKEIFEGDILGDFFKGLYIFYCESEKCFALKNKTHGCLSCEGDCNFQDLLDEGKAGKLKVIGNIYENPERIEI